MAAAAPADDDLPDTPYVYEPDEDEPEPEPVKPKKKDKKQADVITYTIPVQKPTPSTPKPAEKVTTQKPQATIVPIGTKPVVPEKKVSKVDDSKVKVGVKVRHRIFGNGEIIERSDETMTVRFASGGIKKLSIEITLGNHVIEII